MEKKTIQTRCRKDYLEKGLKRRFPDENIRVDAAGINMTAAPDDYTRGWTVPYAVMKGFTAATADAGNVDGLHDYMLDERTGKLKRELYENWRARTTHHMTIVGKAVG